MQFVDEDKAFISVKYFKELMAHEVRSGDLLVAALGDPLGRTCRVPSNIEPAIVKADCLRYRPASSVDPDYLVYWLNSPEGRSQIAALSHGIGRKRINTRDLRKVPVPLAPLPEQRRIVAVLEKLQTHSKIARDELARIPRLAQRYKLAVLSAAFRGDLTSDWRESSTSPNSNSSPGARPQSTHKRYLHALPDSWNWTSIDSTGEVILGRQRSPKNHHGPNMRPYVRAANITWNGWDLSDVKEMNFDDRDFDRFRLNDGDVLVNEGSGSADEVGKPAIWRGEIADCCFQNTLIAVRPLHVTSEYLYYVLLNAAVSRSFVDETRGVNIHHIGRARLAQFPIPLPPKDEQQEIATRLSAAFLSICEIEREVSRATALLDRLDQATLAKAFRGELVPQEAEQPESREVAAE